MKKNTALKALFLDRDGVINIDHGYVSSIEKFEFSEGLFPLLRLFLNHGYTLFILTNQSGIGRGYYSLSDFKKLNTWMLEKLAQEGVCIESVQHCPHAPEEKCTCRKPSTGMVDAILSQYTIDLDTSWLIGDKQSDIDLAKNAHIQYSIAIGKHTMTDYNYGFESILQCKEYLEENLGKILL